MSTHEWSVVVIVLTHAVNLFIEGRGGRSAAGMSRIPSASQRPKGGNGGARRFGLRLRLRVARLQQVAVGIQHFDQADDARSVGGIRAFSRARANDDSPCVRMPTWASRLTRAEKAFSTSSVARNTASR